ncbi:MAG: hypothetical protein M0R37_11940 [Bacteroidales bacterium]|jgi:hypothetical protein|nr:hypothetical protein [Bacteroidales bacterium]
MSTGYHPPVADPLLTHRTESWRTDLIARDGAPLGTLTGITGGGVDHNAARVLHSGGSLDVDDLAQVADWLDLRVRVWWQVAGVDPWPLGTFVCSAPGEAHTEPGRSWSVDLLDLLSVLDGDGIAGSYSLPAGTVVTDAVRVLITDTGETALAVTDSEATLAAGWAWEPGTSRLRIINDLLTSINYFALHTDAYGRFVAAPYVVPAGREPVRDLTADAIVAPDWTGDQDLTAVPNRVVLIGQGSGDTEALVGVAENTDPASRLSIPTRGRTLTHTETGVEAASQAVLTALAVRRLVDLSTPSATRTIAHAPVPLALHDVVVHDGVRVAVSSWSLALELGADMRTGLREVLL